MKEVAEKLHVLTVLEGSVRKQGNRLRITVQLINAEDGYNLWSERYDREIDDIFALQDEIALTITEKLKITLLEKEKAIIQKILLKIKRPMICI
jgi:TolB-like protein